MKEFDSQSSGQEENEDTKLDSLDNTHQLYKMNLIKRSMSARRPPSKHVYSEIELTEIAYEDLTKSDPSSVGEVIEKPKRPLTNIRCGMGPGMGFRLPAITVDQLKKPNHRKNNSTTESTLTTTEEMPPKTSFDFSKSKFQSNQNNYPSVKTTINQKLELNKPILENSEEKIGSNIRENNIKNKITSETIKKNNEEKPKINICNSSSETFKPQSQVENKFKQPSLEIKIEKHTDLSKDKKLEENISPNKNIVDQNKQEKPITSRYNDSNPKPLQGWKTRDNETTKSPIISTDNKEKPKFEYKKSENLKKITQFNQSASASNSPIQKPLHENEIKTRSNACTPDKTRSPVDSNRKLFTNSKFRDNIFLKSNENSPVKRDRTKSASRECEININKNSNFKNESQVNLKTNCEESKL